MNDTELREILIDEKSRVIFDARMQYKTHKSLNLFYQTIKVNDEKYSFREVDEYINESGLTKMYVWGNDDYSIYSYNLLKDAGYNVYGLIIDDLENNNGTANDLIVIFDSIINQLDEFFIIVFERDLPNIPSIILDYGNVLNMHSHVIGRTGNQYFDYFSSNCEEYFLDAGALDGSTTLKFVEWCNGNYGAVYAFEANPSMIDNCLARLKSYTVEGKLHFYGCALWNKKENVLFDNSGSKWDAHVCDEKGILVKADSIDNLLRDRKVTFMKFDIEGSEYKALLGAKKCIFQNRPRMAVSVYHNDSDLEKIMKFIIGLNLEYRFALRHYHSDSIETILYAF